MSLARAWMRQLYGASGVALLVPGAIALALVALALAGGFGQLGDLSQAFAGPAAPAAVHVPRASGTRRATTVLPVVAAAAPVTRIAVAGVRPAVHGAGHAAPRTGGPRAGLGPVVAGGPGNGSTGTGTRTGTAPTGGGTPTPKPGAGSTLVDGVVAVGTKVTSQLPAPVGQSTSQALQTVGNTVNGLLPPNGAQSTVSGAAKALVPGLQLP